MKKKRFVNYNLVGHEKHITALDVKDGIILSGSKDNTVRVWDINRKKAIVFTEHMNWINQAMIWDEESGITAACDKSIRLWNFKSPD